MAIKQNLLLKEGIRVIGFTGGKGRNFLTEQLASELARAINITRDLYQHNFKNIFQANLQESMVKRITTK